MPKKRGRRGSRLLVLMAPCDRAVRLSARGNEADVGAESLAAPRAPDELEAGVRCTNHRPLGEKQH